MRNEAQLERGARLDVPLSSRERASAFFIKKHARIHLLAQVFKDYFGELEEESIRDNFVIIYELMDETMDFGYPQSMDSKILRE